ncbi:hypothetical protein FGIG_06335 [Fasciola gigantica]|uniref:G-protein coupled receptors family 1 profile domain-containing protein n=1 Tax=Fasciola gigantica TaxID=46835 RepID=A0A504YW59_FASGI|nr:hypothetical protein FGIG_06335 [Fasciola gigantica]
MMGNFAVPILKKASIRQKSIQHCSHRSTGVKCERFDGDESNPIREENAPLEAQRSQRQVPATDSGITNRFPVKRNMLTCQPRTCAQIRSNKEKRTNRMILVVILCFIMCCAPGVTCFIVEAVRGVPMARCAKGISLWIGFTNSACNPIIHGLLDKRYRKSFNRLFR